MKKTITISAVLCSMFLFSGCGVSTPAATSPTAQMASATVLRSDDSGATWLPKTKIDDKNNISGINVLSMAIDPQDGSNIYLGSESNGIYESKDSGETWTAVPFADKVYGLAIDHQNPDNIYASGVYNGRAKIFKQSGAGQDWKEIYTEPSNGTVISSLAISPVNPLVLYAGTSAGVLIKSIDGGQNWINLKSAGAPVTSIVFDHASDSHVFFGIFQGAVLETKDGGATISQLTPKNSSSANISNVMTVVADPFQPGVFYVGTNSGIIKCLADSTCSAMNIISSSAASPIRAIAINPANSKEIIYSSAKAIYKSTDGGVQWSTVQLDTNKEISILNYDPNDSTKIYAGLRSF
jgi:photosystem II stability/assembly factor-like uncharacterized protein